ncbi:hypothetical protein [Pseudozobellia thermophila]|uniref:Predicted ATP-dependent carboligase, ATP-grasp superfamily n=1 Tax=Pseudozobellia thermophila TaxID=192903 RepID=A0A1M6BMU3_9FLAO|nr:hypothetical protein [Pseudozobellia thermophila]SHI49823.1 Predicted ATP-dependent carboligase, ATP-grasp superfamily [Pseudozobellia thermophila]
MKNDACAVVLGGYVNGYSIIQELDYFRIKNIALLYHGNQIARFSRRINEKHRIGTNKEDLLSALAELHKKYDRLVLYPTDDHQMENLLELRNLIESYCFLPFNPENLHRVADKAVQYQFCEKLGVPYPKTAEVKKDSDIDDIKLLALPLIIKPNKREDLKIKIFRSYTIDSWKDFETVRNQLTAFMDKGVTFIASEIIPGHTNGTIYAYTAYRSPKTKKIENEWIGRKLTQFPDDYGVFSSASNEAPEIIREQGRKLLEGMSLYGICEPEFKFDERDGKYKLMEINLRSMMWHRTGHLSGVYLQYTQWCDALNIPIPNYVQSSGLLHFCYFKHEIINLIFRRGYFKYFKNNLGGKNMSLALWDKNDPLPFLVDQVYTVVSLIKLMGRKIMGKNA